MNSWCPTLEASLVSPLVTKGVSAPRVIHAFRGFLCLWFNRLGYRKADSFCSDKRRPLCSLGSVRVYAVWHTKGRVPYWVGVFLVENYWSSHSSCDPSTNSFSQQTRLCGSREDKTCFMLVKAPHRRTRPPVTIIFQFVLFFQRQRFLQCLRQIFGVTQVAADIQGSAGGSSQLWNLTKSTNADT